MNARAVAARAKPSAASRGRRSQVRLMGQPVLEPLTWGERLDIVDALSQVLAGVYVHLPLKRSLYGFDVIRALEQLRQELTLLSDLQFHRALTLVMNRLRDAHTQYKGPWRGNGPVASLPFLVESYVEGETYRYVVSKVDRRSVHDPGFLPGVTIEYWNGVPFERALELHAESETGGRPDSRRARALESLTFRALEYAPPPNEAWVILDYRDRAGGTHEIRLEWETFDPQRAPTASGRSASIRGRRGIDPAAELIRRAKKYRFNYPLWRAERVSRRRAPPGPSARFADFVTARSVTTRSGRFGYLRIWSFDVDDDQAFVEAVIELLRRLPQRGLIVDLRSNPGGFIWAAERLLQLFTPHPVSPTRFALRATTTTAAMARAPSNEPQLAPWAESLFSAESTGEPYSSSLPITPPELCNDIGQQYSGPVVVVVDANTYSSGDLFCAGILDNRIGPVVCIGEASGAGGANVWDCDELRTALAAAQQPLPPLPDKVRFTLAVRRAVRSGDAEGTLIEDAGVRGQRYEMTRNDVFRHNVDLIEHCAELLVAQPRTRLGLKQAGRMLEVTSAGLDQLDLYVDGHPGGLPIVVRRDGRQRIRLPRRAGQVEVVGFAGGTLRQRRRLALAAPA